MAEAAANGRTEMTPAAVRHARPLPFIVSLAEDPCRARYKILCQGIETNYVKSGRQGGFCGVALLFLS
jgi:hypothetical protein